MARVGRGRQWGSTAEDGVLDGLSPSVDGVVDGVKSYNTLMPPVRSWDAGIFFLTAQPSKGSWYDSSFESYDFVKSY